ncbi:16S rRNA (uracil(1498)-N(3))-methyltransferase [Candidatus Dojkabacteria bacterium]|jgi:16S rRNA (uracil1498-N3)-methyltransferase|nr:16S rRNA (uracil(1498)-N(3))-methyltransferase [Candidatus Dojkabacteria bacterium]
MAVKTYYIPHKLKAGDITHLADNDSEYAIKIEKVKIEDILFVQSTEYVYTSVITDISNKSVEVEIIEKTDKVRMNVPKLHLALIQSILNNTKMELILEKCTEIGVNEIILVESELCLVDGKIVNKNFNKLEGVIREAGIQSRNQFPPVLNRPIPLSQIDRYLSKDSLNICLSTEIENGKSLKVINETKNNNICIAVGPESGWSVTDLEVFKKNNFQFMSLKGNILRTETVSIVVSSIIKNMKGEI